MSEPRQQKPPSLFNNNNKQSTVNQKRTISSLTPIFVLCDKCYWCSTYLDKTRLLSIDNNKCPNCYTINTLSSFPVMSNESFTFDYDERRGVELKFMNRK